MALTFRVKGSNPVCVQGPMLFRLVTISQSVSRSKSIDHYKKEKSERRQGMVQEDRLKNGETNREIKRLKRNNEHIGKQRKHLEKDKNDERNTEIERNTE